MGHGDVYKNLRDVFMIFLKQTFLELRSYAITCKAMGDVSNRIGRPTNNGQVIIVHFKLIAIVDISVSQQCKVV